MAGKCLVDNLQLDRCNGMSPMYSNNGMDREIIPHIHQYLNSCKLESVKIFDFKQKSKILENFLIIIFLQNRNFQAIDRFENSEASGQRLFREFGDFEKL